MLTFLPLPFIYLLVVACNSLPIDDGSFLPQASRVCSHVFPQVDELPHPVHLGESTQRLVKRAAEHQMRITVFYHDSVEKLGTRSRKIVKDLVVPEAVSYWESVLKIRRHLSNIRLNRKCENNQYFLAPNDPTQYCKNKCLPTKCGEFRVPENHLESCHVCDSSGRNCKKIKDEGDGVEKADFVLYVSALSTRQCGETIGEEAKTVAYAAHCQQEDAMDRPVSGHTNICPAAIKDSADEINGLTSTVKHELLHALGFSSSLFAFFRDKDTGEPLTKRGDEGKPPINRRLQVRQWSDKVIKEVERPWYVKSGTLNRKIRIMVTPRVVEEVRRHFNCSSLEGAELEDQGGFGTAITHWEKRIFQNEAMTGTVHTKTPLYSRVTFALLEDSGWYVPNYDLAQDISWGKDLGCDFATLSCKRLMENDALRVESGQQPIYPFCQSLMQSSPRTFCTADLSAVGSCNLVQFSSRVPAIYQNFDAVEGVKSSDVAKIGSSVTLADFCPYIQEFTWKSTGSSSERGTTCTDQDNEPSTSGNFALESYGKGSRCFEQGSKWEQKSCSTLKQWKRFGAGCYNYKCQDGLIGIIVRNVTLLCEKPGQVIDIKLMQGQWLHTGSVVCPPCENFCSSCTAGKKAKVDPKTLQEDTKGTCYEQGPNDLRAFLSGFGFSLGG